MLVLPQNFDTCLPPNFIPIRSSYPCVLRVSTFAQLFGLRWAQGRNEGGKGGHNSPGAEKSQQCHKYCLQYSTFPSWRRQIRTWGLQPYSCPRRHLTSLRPWLSSNQLMLESFVAYENFLPNQWRSQPKIWGERNVWLQANNSIFVWDVACQSLKWPDMLKIWGYDPWARWQRLCVKFLFCVWLTYHGVPLLWLVCDTVASHDTARLPAINK